MADVQVAKEAYEKLDKEHREIGERKAQALLEYDDARVEAMDQDVVKRAEELGINPRNFEDTKHLQEAVEIRESEEEKKDD